MSAAKTATTADSGRHPELKGMLAEASQALAHLDANRLEEMALSCAALVRDDADRMDGPNAQAGTQDRQAGTPDGQAKTEMAIFMRVLEATRANLNVMRRLSAMRIARLEYGDHLTGGGDHGDH